MFVKNLLLTAVLLLFTACGGGSSGGSSGSEDKNDTEVTQPTPDDNKSDENGNSNTEEEQNEEAPPYLRVITGLVIDGYIDGSTVFLDLNGDGELSEGEPNSLSDGNGSFSLMYGGTENPTLIAIGGTDIDTNRPYEGRLKAPVNGSDLNVTPITTVISEYMEELNQSIDMAEEMISQKLGIDRSKLFKDPVKLAQEESDSSLLSSCWQIEQGLGVMKSAGGDVDSLYSAFAVSMHNMNPPEKGGSVNAIFEEMLQDEVAGDILGENMTEASRMAIDVTKNIDSLFQGVDPTKEEDMMKVAFAVSENMCNMREHIANSDGDVESMLTGGYTLIGSEEFAEFDHREVIARDILEDNNLSDEYFEMLLDNIDMSDKPNDVFIKIEKKTELQEISTKIEENKKPPLANPIPPQDSGETTIEKIDSVENSKDTVDEIVKPIQVDDIKDIDQVVKPDENQNVPQESNSNNTVVTAPEDSRPTGDIGSSSTGGSTSSNIGSTVNTGSGSSSSSQQSSDGTVQSSDDNKTFDDSSKVNEYKSPTDIPTPPSVPVG